MLFAIALFFVNVGLSPNGENIKKIDISVAPKQVLADGVCYFNLAEGRCWCNVSTGGGYCVAACQNWVTVCREIVIEEQQ